MYAYLTYTNQNRDQNGQYSKYLLTNKTSSEEVENTKY